jgi:hypothetical protein
MTRLKRGLVAGAVLLAAAFAGYAALVYTEDVVSTYPTYADAVRDGAVERGWLPAFVPADAFAIREVHNLDNNAQWLRFSVPANRISAMAQGAQWIPRDGTRARHRRPPRWSGSWPASRSGAAPPQPSVSSFTWTGAQDRHWCIEVNRAERMVYAWTCPAPSPPRP